LTADRTADSKLLTSSSLTRPDGPLKQSIEAFLLDQRSPHTRRSYGKDLKRFVQFLLGRVAGFGQEAITRTLIVSYKEYLLADGLEHTTVDRHLSTLRSFFRWLVDDGAIEKNPAEGVRFLKPKRLSRTIGFSDEEVQRILKVPDLHTRTGSLHYAMLMVLFYCGLRRSELCALRTPNLGEERGQHVFRLRGKGNAERVVVVVPAVWNALRHYFSITVKDAALDAPVFMPVKNNRTGQRDKPLDPSQVYYVVTRYAKLAGISNRVSPHSCRATAISNARDHHVPDRAIQEFAGWSSTDMITRYDKRKTAVEDSAAHAIKYGAEDRAGHEGKKATEQSAPSPLKFLETLNLTRRR
jgi:site-specific recombinase XerD